MNAIPIQPFSGEYRVKVIGGEQRWYPCEVVGVVCEDVNSTGHFIFTTEADDGALYVGAAEAVRHVN
jgi:hypothetical protein